MTTEKEQLDAPKEKKRRIPWKWILRGLLALLLLDVALRLRYLPGHTERAFSALPGDAALVGEVTDLSTAWGKTLRAPRVEEWLRLAEIDGAKLADDPGIAWPIRLTTGKTVAMALNLSPERNAGGKIVLSAASYGGWRTPILRFLLTTRWIPGLGRLERTPKGARYLRLGSKRHPSDYVVSFALRREILVAVLSTDPDDILPLEDRLLERKSAEGALAEIAPWDHPEPRYPYRFWALRNPIDDHPLDDALAVRIAPLWDSPAAIKLTLDDPDGKLDRMIGRSRISGRIGKAETLAAHEAPVILLLPPGLTRQELDVRLFHGKRPDRPPEDREQEDDAVAYLTQAPYGSTFLRAVPLPAVTILCPGLALNQPRIEGSIARIAPILGFPTLRGFKPEGNHVYGQIDWLGRYGRHDPFRLSSSECGVIDLPVNGRDLFFCSSMKSLSMQRSGRRDGEAPWRARLTTRLREDRGEAVAFAWIDIDRLFDEGRKLLALVKLFQRISPDSFTTEHLDLLYRVERLLNTFRTPGSLSLLATHPAPNRLELEIELD